MYAGQWQMPTGLGKAHALEICLTTDTTGPE